jgi:hypothetical protein
MFLSFESLQEPQVLATLGAGLFGLAILLRRFIPSEDAGALDDPCDAPQAQESTGD